MPLASAPTKPLSQRRSLCCPQGPFTYEALPPEDIRFVPLKQTQEFNSKDLLEVSRGGGVVGGSARWL